MSVQQPETPGNYRANLAKVGVEGSNPFARAISDTSRNKTANTTSKGDRRSLRRTLVEAVGPEWRNVCNIVLPLDEVCDDAARDTRQGHSEMSVAEREN